MGDKVLIMPTKKMLIKKTFITIFLTPWKVFSMDQWLFLSETDILFLQQAPTTSLETRVCHSSCLKILNFFEHNYRLSKTSRSNLFRILIQATGTDKKWKRTRRYKFEKSSRMSSKNFPFAKKVIRRPITKASNSYEALNSPLNYSTIF